MPRAEWKTVSATPIALPTKAEQTAIATALSDADALISSLEKLIAKKRNIKQGAMQKQLQPKQGWDETAYGERAILEQYLKLVDNQAELGKKIKDAIADLDKKVIIRYKTLTVDEIKQLVVDDKWMASIERSVKTEMERISQRLTQRIKELAERYETPMPEQTAEVAALESKVNAHLAKMGFVWS
jgi:type I restriction enzyme M protein